MPCAQEYVRATASHITAWPAGAVPATRSHIGHDVAMDAAWLRGVRPDGSLAELVCRARGQPVTVGVIHRGADGRLRLNTIGGQLGALDSLADGVASVYECGCHHRVDALEVERLVELSPEPPPLRIDVAIVSSTV